MDRKLSALSELLRADTENERRSAVRLIEGQTGKHFAALLKRGAERTLKKDQKEIAQKLISTYAGDVLLQALDIILQKNSVPWADLIRAGNRLSWREQIAKLCGKKIADGTKSGNLNAIERDALPCSATGIPLIWEKGKTFDGEETVTFYFEKAEANGRQFKPKLSFLAEGNERSKIVRQAAHEKRTLQFVFHEPGARSDLVRATPS
tara:strand:+ start:956 stop:1576 length:621 start_codon:yes stop_codon:yes gene_type:complete